MRSVRVKAIVKLKVVATILGLLGLAGCYVEPEVKEDREAKPPVERAEPSGESPGSALPAPRPTKRVLPAPAPQPALPPPSVSKASERWSSEYSYLYWLNGWRKHPDDGSKDYLCVETGSYGFMMDMANLPEVKFGPLRDKASYRDALSASEDRLKELKPAQLNFDVKVGGRIFRAMSCRAGRQTGVKHLHSARLWESGQLVQHMDFLDLVLQDAQGRRLKCDANLELVAWPSSLAITASITPGNLYRDGPHAGVNGSGWCVVEKPHETPHAEGMDHAVFTLEAWVKVPIAYAEGYKGYLVCKNGQQGTAGNLGFMIDEGMVSAVMNLEGGDRNNLVSIRQQQEAFYIDNWNHMVMTYDGRVMTFYLNGKKQGQRRLDLPRTPGNGPLLLGRGSHPNASMAPAVFDQVLVWNRVLSAEEVAGHAENAQNVPNRDGLTFMELFTTRNRLRENLPDWQGAAVRLQLVQGDRVWKVQKRFPDSWQSGETRAMTLVADAREAPMPVSGLRIDCETANGVSHKVEFDTVTNGYRCEIGRFQRPFKGGYTEIRDYDEIRLTVHNPGSRPLRVPLLLDLRHVPNITGLCPILCDPDGRPLGIHVQLSKNWHLMQRGSYLCAYMLLPAGSGSTEYLLRIPYGFYGTLPSASHANLSLVGYGGNGRWEQLAIGCWGETFCFDMDMSCVDVSITDVRLLMARKGKTGEKWGWTDAGWGGDWLHAKDAKGQKRFPNSLKTAYFAHGPCLTDVQYAGNYGPDDAVAFDATVRTCRSDDAARTFQRIRYRGNKRASLDGGWLFKMGRTGGATRPRVAYGNRDGLIEELTVPGDLVEGELVIDRLTLEGEGPWWIAFPEAGNLRDRAMPVGTRSLIIRGYEASFSGKETRRPTISVPLWKLERGRQPNTDLLLMPPEGVDGFREGDWVDMDLEWFSLPNVAEDYYGPNKPFAQYLSAHPNSWKPVYREAQGNDLQVTVHGGRLLNRFPVIVRAEAAEVTVDIEGGVGCVPIRFEGLHRAQGYTLFESRDGERKALDQSVHGNDFWQVDYDAASNSWKRSYNLPLDGRTLSRWVLVSE